MDSQSLYLMISSTNTGVGKVIRKVTKYPYSHVSLSLNPELDEWVSFARYHKDSPFVGGFIREDIQRLASIATTMPVRIFRIPIDSENYEKLNTLFQTAGNAQEEYYYNLFDAAAGAFHKEIRIPGSYTCLGFANQILGTDYRSIAELSDYLDGLMIYEGEYWNIQNWVQPDPSGEYLKKISFSRQMIETLYFLGKLVKRRTKAKSFVNPLDEIPKVLPTRQEKKDPS